MPRARAKSVQPTEPETGHLPQVSTCFLRNHNLEILLLRRRAEDVEGGNWCTPGGEADAGESFRDCCLRELWEETGIRLPPQQVTQGHRIVIQAGLGSFVLHVFHAMTSSDQLAITLSTEHDKFAWLSLTDAVSLPLVQGLQELLADASHWP